MSYPLLWIHCNSDFLASCKYERCAPSKNHSWTPYSYWTEVLPLWYLYCFIAGSRPLYALSADFSASWFDPCFREIVHMNLWWMFFYFLVLPAPMKVDKSHFRECLLETLSDMFGPECISPLIRGDKMSVTVDDKTAIIDLNSLVSYFCTSRWQ